jgi:sulfotransferase
MNTFKQLVFMSGLPRSGSTLLSAILSQNPLIYSEGNSALAQYMWDAHITSTEKAIEMLSANRRQQTTPHDIISALPYLYYKNTDYPIIVDKCRTWTLPANMELIYKHITPNPKIIVLIRPIDEIVKSFVKVRLSNNWQGNLYSDLLKEGSDPICRPLTGTKIAQFSGSPDFLFIEYKELTTNTTKVIKSIYDFCNWDYFEHDLENIINVNHEDDSVYGLYGLHDIRKTISPIKNQIVLPDEIQIECDKLTKMIYPDLIKLKEE